MISMPDMINANVNPVTMTWNYGIERVDEILS